MKRATDRQRSEHQQPRGLPESAELQGDVLRRSAILALIIGSALTWINQFDALFGSDTIQILPLFLAYVTPFIFLYFAGKYLQPRRLSSAAFGRVYRRVLRRKLSANISPTTVAVDG